MATTSGGLVKRSSTYDADVLTWFQEYAEAERRARAQRVTVDWLIREAMREYRDRHQSEPDRLAS